jgi:hypothetical protein
MNSIEIITQNARIIKAEPVVKDMNVEANITVTRNEITITGR